MVRDPLHWFPNTLFSQLLLFVCLGIFLVDYVTPRLTANSGRREAASVKDHGSYWLIQAAALLAVGATVGGRLLLLWVVTGTIQWVGLLTMVTGICFREWAVISLGRFFSRVVATEPGQQLIVTGPYHWLRHPAYTGMILVYIGLGMALGSIDGTIAAALIMLAATLYRIRVEEHALQQRFGPQYTEYSRDRWMLFPGC